MKYYNEQRRKLIIVKSAISHEEQRSSNKNYLLNKANTKFDGLTDNGKVISMCQPVSHTVSLFPPKVLIFAIIWQCEPLKFNFSQEFFPQKCMNTPAWTSQILNLAKNIKKKTSENHEIKNPWKTRLTVVDKIHRVYSTVQKGSVFRHMDNPWLLTEIFYELKAFHGSLLGTSVCDMYMFNWHFDRLWPINF